MSHPTPASPAPSPVPAPSPAGSSARDASRFRRFDPLLRLMEHETELARHDVLRLELALARCPGVQKLIRSFPCNLKALAPNLVPFPAWLWRRAGDRAAQLRPGRLDGAPGRRRLDAAFEYLHRHSRATLADAARYAGLTVRKLRQSPRCFEFCVERGLPPPRRFTKGLQLQRALAYLRGHRPRSMRQVALATGVSPALLSLNRTFRAAWARYESSPACRQNAGSKVHRALEARRRPPPLRIRGGQGECRCRPPSNPHSARAASPSSCKRGSGGVPLPFAVPPSTPPAVLGALASSREPLRRSPLNPQSPRRSSSNDSMAQSLNGSIPGRARANPHSAIRNPQSPLGDPQSFDPSVYTTLRWRRLSRYIRFVRAKARCEHCGVHHGTIALDFRSVILLTCAHLNGNSRDLRPENLRALCPKCHFEYDSQRRTLQRLGLPIETIAALARDPRRRAARALARQPARGGAGDRRTE